ncbi:FkbM family methyltransferase [Nocardiopsis potens]|uniref:FkbM family methyltransferase n=1 Tax=Nocardiopsis potens TaxID=1246458 RepID=UPI00034C21C4|nr:FkbM family methyltransferase [Nocardiopsis potens]
MGAGIRRAAAHGVLGAAGRWVSFVEAEMAGLRRVVRPGDVCLDAGAEYGLYSYALSHLVGERGEVHAFEPQPGPFGVIGAGVAALGCGNVRRHREALGAREGGAVMSVPVRRGLPVHGRAFVTDGASGKGPNEEFAGERAVPVSVRTVDGLVESGELGRVDFVKADVEGAEPLVLEGAEKTLERYRPALLLEIEDRHLAKYGRSADGLTAWLRERGYAMQAWSRTGWRPVDRVVPQRRNYLFRAQ